MAIAQNVDTGAVLMQGFANKDALLTTISSRKATFYSRSRSTLWTKGETSLNFINVSEIFLDCDRDSVSFLAFFFSVDQLYPRLLPSALLKSSFRTYFSDNVPWEA